MIKRLLLIQVPGGIQGSCLILLDVFHTDQPFTHLPEPLHQLLIVDRNVQAPCVTIPLDVLHYLRDFLL